MSAPLIRVDVACNDPDNGLFAYRAEEVQFDNEVIELRAARQAPRFTEIDGGFRFLRHNWRVRKSVGGYGNWCWNAYWLDLPDAVALLSTLHQSTLFDVDTAASALFDRWEDRAPIDPAWLSRLLFPNADVTA